MLPLLLRQDGKKAVKRNAFATNLARKYGKNPARLAENIAVFDFAPEGENVVALSGMNQNRRTSHDPLTFDF